MSVKMRQRVERIIARAFIVAALADGYEILVNNGEEEVGPFGNVKTVLGAMFATDEEHLIVTKGGKRIGWVFFVYGNDGWDVISDYTINLEHLMAGANKISERYA